MRPRPRHRLAPLLVAACGLGAGLVVTPGARATAAPAASLTPIACRSSPQASLRRVASVAVMHSEAGVRTLNLRITLLRIAPGRRPQAVSGGDLGRWLTPAVPSLGRNPHDVWRLNKAVYGVSAPDRYRFRVDFRWRGAHGRVIARRTLTTGTCAVRTDRPDLVVRSVTVRALAGRTDADRYVAVLANRGSAASGPFAVAFDPGDGAPSQTRTERSLAPGHRMTAAFTGPVCDPEDPARILAEPTDRVDDPDGANDARTATCLPVAGAAESASRRH